MAVRSDRTLSKLLSRSISWFFQFFNYTHHTDAVLSTSTSGRQTKENNMSTRISTNFTLEEFLVSQTAVRHGIDMTPSLEIEANIRRLIFEIMQPLRDITGPLLISSGYRPEDLNSLIGGSKTSAHRFGCAADFRSNNHSPLDLCKMIVDLVLPFDQVIHEFGHWVHVGIRWDDQPIRKQMLTAHKEGTRTVYTPGLLEVNLDRSLA